MKLYRDSSPCSRGVVGTSYEKRYHR